MLNTRPPIPTTERAAPDQVDAPVSCVGDVADKLDAGQHDRDHDRLEQERHPPRQVGGDEAPEQRPDRGGYGCRGPDEGIYLLLSRTLEVAVDQRLHRRQQQRRADPAQHRPEDHDRDQVLCQRHRHSAYGVAQQPQHVCPFAAEEIADLAADQDERGRHKCLERDRRLHSADGRAEIVHHRRDRDVHQRCVDDEHEHRHRQQQGEPLAARSLHSNAGARGLGQAAGDSAPSDDGRR
jgi:hypothetical protein